MAAQDSREKEGWTGAASKACMTTASHQARRSGSTCYTAWHEASCEQAVQLV